MLTTKIQKLIATERIPLVVLIVGEGTNPPPGEFVPPFSSTHSLSGALSVNPESNP